MKLRKKAKNAMKMAIVILLGILTFNIVYDVGLSASLKNQSNTDIQDVTGLDKVKAIAEQEVELDSLKPADVKVESKKSKIIKYASIIGIIIIAIAMLIILTNKEELDD